MSKVFSQILIFLLILLNGTLDSLLAWFLPRWRRVGNEMLSRLSHDLHHYKPEIEPRLREEMRADIARLRTALLYWRRGEVQELAERVRVSYLDTMPSRCPVWVESLESIVVVLVVLLGLRAYYVQPFRIPTNSMWPSLNGIVVHAVDEWPSLPQRLWDKVTLGSTYVDVKADRRKRLVRWRDERYAMLFTRTILEFDDGSEVELPASTGTVLQYLRDRGKIVSEASGALFTVPFEAGETIMRARIDAGDMILADRVSYQFRLPRRGETFVFDTRGINTSNSRLRDQTAATHYIKRLCGLPGDTVSIRSPQLIINGQPATEPGIARVAAAKPPYGREGYHALSPLRVPGAYFTTGSRVQLAKHPRPYLSEFLALGDNTENSLDSRYWGPVRQFNVLGPACFTLWPFTAHWGSIDTRPKENDSEASHVGCRTNIIDDLRLTIDDSLVRRLTPRGCEAGAEPNFGFIPEIRKGGCCVVAKRERSAARQFVRVYRKIQIARKARKLANPTSPCTSYMACLGFATSRQHPFQFLRHASKFRSAKASQTSRSAR